jgi:hypothetical protein
LLAGVGERDGILNRHDLRSLILPLLHLANHITLGPDGLLCGELSPRLMLLSQHGLEFAGRNPRLKVGADLRIGGFAHSAP